MNLSNEQVQIILDDFVVDNAEDINEVQNTNPVLYDAVIDALNYISKKFGTQDKLEIPETITKVEEVLEISTKEKAEKKSTFDVGDLFFIGGFPKDVYFIKDISQIKIDFKRIPRSNALTESMATDDFKRLIEDKSIIFLPNANELTFEVGDLLINQIGDVSRVDYIDFNTNSVILVTQIGGRNVSQKTMYLTDVVDKIDEGILRVEKVGSFQSNPAPQKQSTLVVGDIIRGMGGFFEVVSIDNDTIYFDKLDNNFKASYVPIKTAEESLSDGTWKKVRRPQRGDVFKSSIGKEYIIRNISTSNIDIEIAWYDKNHGFQTTTYKIWDVLDNYEDGTFTLVSEGNDVNEFIENQKNNLNPQSNVQQAKVYSFKEGDDFYYASNPSIVYKIDKINANGDVDTSTKGGTEWTLDAEALEEEIQDGTVIIGLPIIVQSSQTSSKLTLQEQINELKDSIDAFKLLADLGDTDAIDEVKKLKKELKDLKSTNK
jgi:hypothetical protein